MNNISQISIFDYREIENLGDLERLKIFFENIQDNELCQTLEKERKNGRNDYPVRTMLNLIYAMKIFGHRSIESFRRELSRNSQLRIACGLSEGKFKYCGERKHLVPLARVFTGFLSKLKKHKKEINEIYENLVKFMYENLEGFGEDCAVDGKFLDTYANQYKENRCNDSKKFKTKYKMRTEIERLNGRIDRDYMFNDHFIRGQEKMELMLNLTFIVMLTIAKGHIKNKQENIRSLVA